LGRRSFFVGFDARAAPARTLSIDCRPDSSAGRPNLRWYHFQTKKCFLRESQSVQL
jgi:hypothetical protein